MGGKGLGLRFGGRSSQKLLLLKPGRALWLNGSYFLCYFAFGAGDGGFLKIRSSYCFFS